MHAFRDSESRDHPNNRSGSSKKKDGAGKRRVEGGGEAGAGTSQPNNG
jgi:hypothetical protein